MSFTIKVDIPNLPPGERVQVMGLGMLENGKTFKITDEQAAEFRAMTGKPVTRKDGSGASDFVEGPDLDKANFPEGITVTRTAPTKKGDES